MPFVPKPVVISKHHPIILQGVTTAISAISFNQKINIMNKQFSFTSTGVQQWQTELYQQGATAIQNERTLIEGNFITWLFARFMLDSDQQAFAQNLGAPTHQIYAVAVSNALEEQTPILLEKEDGNKSKQDDYDHPKFSELRYQITSSSDNNMIRSTADTEQKCELIFSLYYLDIER